MEIFKKIQELPLGIRKILLWSLLIVISIILILVWTKIFTKKFKNFQSGGLMEELKIPYLKEKLEKDINKVEIPQIPDLKNK